MKILGILIKIFSVVLLLLPFRNTGFAAQDDLKLTQWVALTRSSGDLSKNSSHVSLQTSLARTHASYSAILGIDVYHEFGAFLESFKTRGPERLLFPFAPNSSARVIEPSLSLGVCAFAQTSIQLCPSIGLSLVHIQTTIQTYQMYGAFPVQARLVWKPLNSAFSTEIGARYRTLRTRVEGYVSSHQDLSYLIGIGLNTNSR